ncbi:hypothetical protein CEXT_98571 [Caerostris extrusa]|uniref:Uncharacterized protein n=1 Tax=Caerostris extrusa TaxID=172846 RepID=A0AAV4XG92_CAEEX|nr:hypothetical protein CEXT_98571 [Caerostris extrusa]
MDKLQLFYNLIQQMLETNQKARIWHYFQARHSWGDFLSPNLFYAPLRTDFLDETNKRYPYRNGNGYHSERFNRGSIFWVLVGGTSPLATMAAAILCLWELLIPFNLDSQLLEIWKMSFSNDRPGGPTFSPSSLIGRWERNWKKWRRTKGCISADDFYDVEKKREHESSKGKRKSRKKMCNKIEPCNKKKRIFYI